MAHAAPSSWHFRNKLAIFDALERRSDLPNQAFGDRLRARLAAGPDLDPLDELADTILQGCGRSKPTPNAADSHDLWLRCEYVGEMLPALERRRRADAALEQLFVDAIALAAARHLLAPGQSPRLRDASTFLVNGSVDFWLRAPGEARLETELMSLVIAFLKTIARLGPPMPIGEAP